MTTVLAVDIYDKRAKVLALQAEPGERVTVLRTEDVELPGEIEPAAEGENGASSPEGGEQKDGDGSEVSPDETLSGMDAAALAVFSDLEIDSTFAVSASSQVLYSQLSFPFRDQKKIEQVAPLQVQDSLPFEIDDFVLDSVVLGESKPGEFQVLSTLTPKHEVASTLASLNSIGIDPKFLTTRASALGNLANFCHPGLEGLNAYILVSENRLSFAAIIGGTIVSLRELTRTDNDLESSVRSLACSILSLEQQNTLETTAIYVVASASELSYLRRMLFRPVIPLDLAAVVDLAPGVESSLDSIASALGAAASELLPKKRGEPRRFVDFRQGPFAYRRTWIALWGALKQEAFYISIALFLAFMWFGGRLYLSSYALSQVNRRIYDSVHSALPGDAIPKNGEATYVQTKLDSLEEELRGMGSLSSLSPLESLKELVQAVPDLDLVVDNINIGYSKMTLRGSVADNLSIGKLSAALKARKDRFCDVKVDPKGKTGDNRVGFSAEIAFCE